MIGSYSAVLRRRLPLVVLLTVLLGSLGAVVLTQRAEVYRSEALIEVTSGSVAEQVVGQARGYEEPERRVATEIEVLESRPVAEAAVDRLRGQGLEISVEAAALAVTAVARGTSNYVEVSATAADPLVARDLTDAFVAAYLEYRSTTQSEELAVLQAELQAQLSAAETELAVLDGDDGAVDGERARAALLERIETATGLLEQVRLRSAVETSAVRQLSAATIPSTPEGQLRPGAAAALAVFAAYLLALGFVFALEVWQDAVRSREEAERLVGAVSLLEVPSAPPPPDPVKPPRLDPTSVAAARTLRLRVEGVSGGSMPRRVLFTGLGPEAGQVLDSAVLLVRSCADSGMSVAMVADTGWTASAPGDGDLVLRGVRFAEVPDLPGVQVARATTRGGDAAPGVLDSGSPATLLQELDARVDLVVLVAVEGGEAEAVAVAHLADTVLLVAAVNQTRGRPLVAFVESLRVSGADVQGLVLRGEQRRSRSRRAKQRHAVPAAQPPPPAPALPKDPVRASRTADAPAPPRESAAPVRPGEATTTRSPAPGPEGRTPEPTRASAPTASRPPDGRRRWWRRSPSTPAASEPLRARPPVAPASPEASPAPAGPQAAPAPSGQQAASGAPVPDGTPAPKEPEAGAAVVPVAGPAGAVAASPPDGSGMVASGADPLTSPLVPDVTVPAPAEPSAWQSEDAVQETWWSAGGAGSERLPDDAAADGVREPSSTGFGPFGTPEGRRSGS